MSLRNKSLKSATFALALSGILAISSTPSHAVLGDQVLKFGMDNEDVQVLQQELINLGHFSEENITTYYGSLTEQAVRAFQITQGIEINGVFDTITYEALKGIKNKSEEKEEVVGTISTLTFDRELSLKTTGEDVRLLQEALKGLGYLVIDNCTDYFGSMTQEALIAFQLDNGLKPNGISGLRTIETINQVLLGRGISLPVATRGSELSTVSANIAATARKFLGYRYVSGGASPSGFDCSGFTLYVYKQFGINLPRTSTSQAYVGKQISKADLIPGDLLIFSNTYKKGPSHTGIYLGNGQFIHASTSTTGVIISDLNSTYYTKHFSYGRRLY